MLERHEQAVAHCQRVIDVSRATGQGGGLLFTMTAQAWSLVRMGRLDDADEVLDRGDRRGPAGPEPLPRRRRRPGRRVATYRGEHDRARAPGEESVRLASAADPGLIPGMSGLYLAIAQIEAGDAQGAHETLLDDPRAGRRAGAHRAPGTPPPTRC